MSDCINWRGVILDTGYGQVKSKGKNWLAHRWIYTMEVGPIPDGMVIAHECDNKKCVNIEHLKCMTQSENVQQSYDKGRRIGPGRKLSDDNVRITRIWLDLGYSQRSIAKAMRVSVASIRGIKRGITYAEIS